MDKTTSHEAKIASLEDLSLNGWATEVHQLSRSKGWYEDSELSPEVQEVLSRLPEVDRAALLPSLLAGTRQPKNRIDVSGYVANNAAELSELWEAFRTGDLDKPCDKEVGMMAIGLPVLTSAEEEMADVLIRDLDTCKFWGIDIGRAVAIKHLYNSSRPQRHGGKRA